MKKGCVIEPDFFARPRMSDHGGTGLPSAQSFFRNPLGFDAYACAIALDLRSLIDLKDSLPRQTESCAVIANIEDATAQELFLHRRIDGSRDRPIVADRRLASFERWRLTVEHEVVRTEGRVGVLVVRKYVLVRGVIGRRINVMADLRAWRGAKAIFERGSAHVLDALLEILHIRQCKSPQQDRAMACR